MQRILGWLRQGWRDFRSTIGQSLATSAIYTLLGMALIWGLALQGQLLLAYPFAAGFLLVAPVLLAGFHRAAFRLRLGGEPRFSELLMGVMAGPPGIWFLGFILAVCYLIWVTDALVIYAIYFDFQAVPLPDAPLDAQAPDEGVRTYLLFSGVMGLFFAVLGFAVSIFAVPLIVLREMSFVSAILSSVRTVFRHLWLMLGWGLTLSLLVFLGLLVLPLMVVILPVLAYASHAVYLDIYPPDESGPAAVAGEG